MNDHNKPSQQVTMTYSEMISKFYTVERRGDHLSGYIVFTPESFNKPYDERSRTYAISSDNKAFQPGMGGYSIYGSCLDGTDPCVRLERYMACEKGGKDGWQIELCYCMSDDLERVAHLLKSNRRIER